MDVIQQFEEYLVENGVAPKTIESYVGDVKAFCAFLREMRVHVLMEVWKMFSSDRYDYLRTMVGGRFCDCTR